MIVKVVLDKKAYIQLKDLRVLSYGGEFILAPKSIVDRYVHSEAHGEEYLEFKKPAEIAWIKSMPYSVDFLTLNKLSDRAVDKLLFEIMNKRAMVAETFDALNDERKIENEFLDLKYWMMRFEIESIVDFKKYRRGEKELELPKEVKGLLLGSSLSVKSKKR